VSDMGLRRGIEEQRDRTLGTDCMLSDMMWNAVISSKMKLGAEDRIG